MSLYSVPVLVVDDSSVMIRVVAGCLRSIGFQHIDTATNGHVALDKLRAHHFGLVICDYVMPSLTGMELRRMMEATPALAGIPFLLITTQPPDSPLKAKYPDLCDYALKPFTIDTLKAKVDRLLVAGEEQLASRALACA